MTTGCVLLHSCALVFIFSVWAIFSWLLISVALRHTFHRLPPWPFTLWLIEFDKLVTSIVVLLCFKLIFLDQLLHRFNSLIKCYFRKSCYDVISKCWPSLLIPITFFFILRYVYHRFNSGKVANQVVNLYSPHHNIHLQLQTQAGADLNALSFNGPIDQWQVMPAHIMPAVHQ